MRQTMIDRFEDGQWNIPVRALVEQMQALDQGELSSESGGVRVVVTVEDVTGED